MTTDGRNIADLVPASNVPLLVSNHHAANKVDIFLATLVVYDASELFIRDIFLILCDSHRLSLFSHHV